MKVRVNILVLAAIGAVLVGILAFVLDDANQVIAVAGAFVGGLAGTMSKLAEPDPDPSMPASLGHAMVSALHVRESRAPRTPTTAGPKV